MKTNLKAAEQSMAHRQTCKRSAGAARGTATVLTVAPTEAAFSLTYRDMAVDLRARMTLPIFAEGLECRHCRSALDPHGGAPPQLPWEADQTP